MQYLSSNFIDFDEICMAVHISRSDPIGNQKFKNLKIGKPKILDCSHLKN